MDVGTYLEVETADANLLMLHFCQVRGLPDQAHWYYKLAACTCMAPDAIVSTTTGIPLSAYVIRLKSGHTCVQSTLKGMRTDAPGSEALV